MGSETSRELLGYPWYNTILWTMAALTWTFTFLGSMGEEAVFCCLPGWVMLGGLVVAKKTATTDSEYWKKIFAFGIVSLTLASFYLGPLAILLGLGGLGFMASRASSDSVDEPRSATHLLLSNVELRDPFTTGITMGCVTAEEDPIGRDFDSLNAQFSRRGTPGSADLFPVSAAAPTYYPDYSERRHHPQFSAMGPAPSFQNSQIVDTVLLESGPGYCPPMWNSRGQLVVASGDWSGTYPLRRLGDGHESGELQIISPEEELKYLLKADGSNLPDGPFPGRHYPGPELLELLSFGREDLQYAMSPDITSLPDGTYLLQSAAIEYLHLVNSSSQGDLSSEGDLPVTIVSLLLESEAAPPGTSPDELREVIGTLSEGEQVSDPLRQVRFIGPIRQSFLQQANIRDLRDLVMADPISLQSDLIGLEMKPLLSTDWIQERRKDALAILLAFPSNVGRFSGILDLDETTSPDEIASAIMANLE